MFNTSPSPSFQGQTAMTSKPSLRWGIVGTGLVSSWFVQNLTAQRPDAEAIHIIRAIGSSSQSKGHEFVKKFIGPLSTATPTIGQYDSVYANPDVDIIYVATPHGFHRQACLDAIAAGKHVLCEKAFCLTAKEARTVFAAAEEKGGIFVMEAMRIRFFPLVQQLPDMVYKEKAIGSVHRVFCDLGLDMDISALGQDSRLRNPSLGAGTLLEICIYSLTWGVLLLDPDRDEKLDVKAHQTLHEGIDIATSVLMSNTKGGHGVLTSTSMARTPAVFCRIEGTGGHITIQGESASIPSSFTVHRKAVGGQQSGSNVAEDSETYTLEPGVGLHWEADATALDIAAGRTQNDIMPWAETMRIMEMMDSIRMEGGARFPQDDE